MSAGRHAGALRAALLSLLALVAPLTAGAAEYVVLVQDQPAGHLKVQTAADGTVETDFSFRDNGRGPDLRERFRLDAGGAPVAYEVAGRTTFGAVVREEFKVEGGRVRWTSRADQGEQPAPPDFAFLPLESTAGYQAELFRLALARGAAGIPTLNGLRLRGTLTRRLTLPGPSGPLNLALAEVTGAGAEPWYAWVRDDGRHDFFAITWPAWAIVEKGHEALVPTLVQQQVEAADERLVRLRSQLAQPLPGLTLIRGVRWFDAPAARMRGPDDVWLHGGRIAAVTAPGALRAARPDRVVDGAGRTLLPGLWDLHGHFWAGEGLAYLAAGVTGARDPANDNAELARTMGRIARGEIAGPRIVPAGFIEGRSPFSSRNGFVVETLQAGLEAVEWYAARGFRSIKLYNSVRPEWVRPLAARAHALGLRVSGHVPAFMRAEQAVRDGYDEITHINQVMLNFVVRDGDDTRTLMRFERVGQDGQRLDLKGPEARRFLALLKARGTTIDPTLVAFEAMFTQAQGQPNPVVADIAEHLPVLWQRGLRSAEMDLEGPRLTTFRASWRRMLELTAAMHRAGLTLVAGTDGWSGVGLHRELALYVQAGLTPAEALRIGTWNGARVAGESGQRGRIARGHAADLVLVDGDPTRRIEDLRRASLVIQGEVAYAPAALYEAMGWKPFVPAARFEAPPP